MLVHQNHGAGGGNGSIMVGMFVCLCLVSKKPSEREFVVPAGTDLGVKLLSEPTIYHRFSFWFLSPGASYHLVYYRIFRRPKVQFCT